MIMAYIQMLWKKYNPRKSQIYCIIHIRFQHNENDALLMSPLTSLVRTAHGAVYSIQHYMINLSVTYGRSVIFDVNKQIHHVGKVFPKGI